MFNIAFTWCRVLFSILTKSTFWTKISKLNSNLSLQRKGQEQNVFLFKKNKIANHILSNSEKQTSPQENTAQQLAFECDTEEFHLANYKIKKKKIQQHPTKSTDKREISCQQILPEVPQT